ncbi:MAG: Do family serine endopeptidase [Bacteroidaceae bacterium]|nr:Do family serine endopeptidase [Bacteroidaceae bacterium]
MNKTTKTWMGAAALVLGTSVVTASVVNQKGAPVPEPAQAVVPAMVAAPSAYVDLTTAAETAVNSVVYIAVTIEGKTQRIQSIDPFEDFFGDFFGFGQRRQQPQQREYKQPDRKGAGSGVIISQDGYIVTNNHVVGQADAINVKLNDGREFKGRIIGTDESTDLALVKIDAKNLPAIKIGDSDALKLGQWVLAVGNPFNLSSTVTAGIVSAKARSLGANGVESFIQTDAAINAGNSGGALVNEQGELVGINSMIYSQTGSYAGYGFAIPTTIMNKVVADLKVYGTVQRAILGVQGQDVDTYIDVQKEKGETPDLGTTKGVYIAKVSDGSAAEEAGLEAGDVVTSIDGREVTKMSHLQEQIAQHKPGDKVNITYLRNKKTKSATVTLRNSQGTTKVMQEVDLDQLGVSLRPITDDEKQSLGIGYGLVVNNIRRGKMMDAGATKGTILLEVNDKKMQSLDDWEDVVKDANQSSDRALWIKAVKPSGRKQSIVVDLNE